jgi:alpha-D-xyloside xylohydrolase
MDFPTDKSALDINDQFMFGKSILVSPVTQPMDNKPTVVGKDTIKVEDFSTIKSKETYLPSGTDWFDFWSGEKLTGGKKITSETPIDIMPVYIRAGAILPIGPRVQYATEKKWDNLELRIYPGANGQFVLYEDENDNYNYEKGLYSTITFNWNDKSRTLTVSDRNGSFPGMLTTRKFNIVLVGPGKGLGDSLTIEPNRIVEYSGKRLTLKL